LEDLGSRFLSGQSQALLELQVMTAFIDPSIKLNKGSLVSIKIPPSHVKGGDVQLEFEKPLAVGSSLSSYLHLCISYVTYRTPQAKPGNDCAACTSPVLPRPSRPRQKTKTPWNPQWQSRLELRS
jgi:hypothetical protein